MNALLMYDLKVCGHRCPKFIVSTSVNHRDREKIVWKEALREHTLSSHAVGHMLVILEKSSGFGCKTTTARA